MKTKLPWGVYVKKFHFGFKSRIVEIVDSEGQTVMHWSGFDATGLSHAKQKALAKFIISAVNRQYRS